jgi:hypothetical protein
VSLVALTYEAKEKEGIWMTEHEFRRAVSTDRAPQGGRCEWCGKPAAVQLTAIGGPAHNGRGLFCRACGDTFEQIIVQGFPVESTTSYHAR